MTYEKKGSSPNGTYVIGIVPWEVQMSLWIETPLISVRATDERLLTFKNPHWSLDRAEWHGDSVVTLTLRKFPGDQARPDVQATVNCLARTAIVDGQALDDLRTLEAVLDQAIKLPPAR